MNTDLNHFDSARIERAIRERYAPMANLTMEILRDQLNAFRVGELRAAARTWEIMVERDGEIATNLGKRCADTARLEWDIHTTDDSPRAKRHADALRYAYDNLRTSHVLDQDEKGGIRTLLRQMLLAHAHRYSVHEMALRVDSAARRQVTLEMRLCPVWFFEARRGRLAYLKNEAQLYGEPLQPGEWLVTVGAGHMRSASVAYLTKWLPMSAWCLYAQRFGVPGIHGKTDASPGTTEWDAFAEALQSFANNWVTVTNRGAEISLVEAGSGTGLPFPALIENADRLYAKLFRGGDLATQSRGNESVGASLQVGEGDALLADDSELINETLNHGIDRPLIAYLFDEEPLAYFRLTPPKRRNVEQDIRSAEFLSSRGARIGVADAMERLGWSAAQDGEETLQAPVPTPAPVPGALPASAAANSESNDGNRLEDSGRDELLRGLDADLEPVRSRLAAIEAIADPDIRRGRLEALLAEWDSLTADILADPATAQALTRIGGAAMVNGLTRRPRPSGSPADESPLP